MTANSSKSTLMGLIPGKDQGAGDSETPEIPKELRDDALNMELLQASLSGLEFPNSAHGSKPMTHDMRPDNETEEDLDTSDPEDDESGIEPLCSYPYGYIKRQTVYVCLTCNDPSQEGWQPAGVCIGCRHACHKNHDVVSLETRRNFRCDCGNKKFPNGISPCILCPEKSETNELNAYSSNYKGTFCSCECKESECVETDPLYQCIVCEDWYHANHCNAESNGIEKNYTDLVCGICISKLDFLRHYDPFDSNEMVNESAVTEMLKYADMDTSSEDEANESPAEVCKLDTLVKKDSYSKGQLWTLGWRSKLCRCDNCKKMYASLNVSFLLDRNDETRRYFEDDEEEEVQNKVCTLIQKFEEWLLKMSAEEREELFGAGQEVVKAKMLEYFTQIEKEGDEEFGDELLNQLFQCFSEYILEDENGMDYLFDMDALEKVFKTDPAKAAEAGDQDLEKTKGSE